MGAALISLSEVLDRLMKVFREEGYDSATLSRLAGATGLGKASLYHHFPGGKADMAIAVANHSNQLFRQQVIAPLRSDAPACKRIDQMIRNLDSYYAKGASSCLLGMLAMGSGSALLQQHIREGLGEWIRTLAETLEQAGLAKGMAHQKAEDTVCRIEGALLLARGTGDTSPFKRILTQIRQDLLPTQHQGSA